MFCCTIRPGMRMYSAYAPLLKSRSSQRFGWPFLQYKQTLQGAEFDGTTRMPLRTPPIHRAAVFFDHSRQLVAEKRRRLDHARRDTRASRLSDPCRRSAPLPPAPVLRLPQVAEYRLARSSYLPRHTGRPPTCVRFFLYVSCVSNHHFKRVSAGCAANSNASAICSSGNRCEIIRVMASGARKQVPRIRLDRPPKRCSCREFLSLRRPPPPREIKLHDRIVMSKQ